MSTSRPSESIPQPEALYGVNEGADGQPRSSDPSGQPTQGKGGSPSSAGRDPASREDTEQATTGRPTQGSGEDDDEAIGPDTPEKLQNAGEM